MCGLVIEASLSEPHTNQYYEKIAILMYVCIYMYVCLFVCLYVCNDTSSTCLFAHNTCAQSLWLRSSTLAALTLNVAHQKIQLKCLHPARVDG